MMVDIETMGTKHNAPILSIGAIEFNPHTGELGETFYGRATLASQKQRPIDGDTLEWWMKQGDLAQQQLFGGERTSLLICLGEFQSFCKKSGAANLWSNGPTFDEDILRHAFEEQSAMVFPFHFSKSRCCRTAKHFGSVAGAKQNHKPEVAHDALSDAIAQAKNVMAVFAAVR